MAIFEVSRNAQRGVAIIMATFAIVILGVLAAGFMVSSITEHQMSFNETEATASVQCADGGISAGFQALSEMEPPPCGVSGAYDLGTYTYADGSTVQTQLVYADTNDCSNEHQGWGYTIHSECEMQSGTRAVIEMEATANKETPACILIPACCSVDAWYWDYDIVQGRVHCNPRIWIYNSSNYPPRGARFYGRVTSAAPSFRCAGEDGGGGCPEGYATFYDGYELNVDPVDCVVDYSAAVACVNDDGILLSSATDTDHETWITLVSDGTMLVYQPDGVSPYNIPPGAPAVIPNGSVVALDATGSDGDMHIQGTLNGDVTFMAGRMIVIEADILLNDDPRMGPSDDRLGLLAGWRQPSLGHLFIADVLPGVDGDRQIFGNYVGPDCEACVWVDQYTSRARQGILMIYGTIMQGRLRATETPDAEHGYGTDTILDPRTCPDPPPCFPDLAREDGTVQWVATKIPKSWGEIY